jgi:hypothetical protein
VFYQLFKPIGRNVVYIVILIRSVCFFGAAIQSLYGTLSVSPFPPYCRPLNPWLISGYIVSPSLKVVRRALPNQVLDLHFLIAHLAVRLEFVTYFVPMRYVGVALS